MTNLKFVLLLFLTLIISCGIVFFMISDAQSQSKTLLIIILTFFTVFTGALFFVLRNSARSKDHHLFTRIFLLSIFLKIIFFVFIILFSVRKFQVEKKEVIIPSMIVYVMFTILETYVLMNMSKEKRLLIF